MKSLVPATFVPGTRRAAFTISGVLSFGGWLERLALGLLSPSFGDDPSELHPVAMTRTTKAAVTARLDLLTAFPSVEYFFVPCVAGCCT